MLKKLDDLANRKEIDALQHEKNKLLFGLGNASFIKRNPSLNGSRLTILPSMMLCEKIRYQDTYFRRAGFGQEVSALKWFEPFNGLFRVINFYLTRMRRTYETL